MFAPYSLRRSIGEREMVVRFHTLRMPIDRIWLTLIY